VYSDLLYHDYCGKKIEKVVQNEALNLEFNIHGDILRELVDMNLTDSVELSFDTNESSIVQVSLCYDSETNLVLGSESIGKHDIT
jgi:hypothetical protein